MTIVENNPQPPTRRALLPRNPTPWGTQSTTTVPTVQRLLLQSGPSYKTYQPFQVLSPLITPEISQDKCPRLNNTNTPNPLTHLCRDALLTHCGLRKVRHMLCSVMAPKRLIDFMTRLNARECVVRSSAPLLDIFSEPFFHRTVTWRVLCCVDQHHYLATYANTDHSLREGCRWASSPSPETQDSEWVWLAHPHIMRIWGTVLDDVTGNTFYLLDTPIATMQQIQNHLSLWCIEVPEEVIWCFILSISSALNHCDRRGLSYGSLTLSNVFLLNSGIVIENELTRKKKFHQCPCRKSSPSLGCVKDQTHTSQTCLTNQLIDMTLKLCSSTYGDVKTTNNLLLDVLKKQYSSTLLRFLSKSTEVSSSFGGEKGESHSFPFQKFPENRNCEKLKLAEKQRKRRTRNRMKKREAKENIGLNERKQKQNFNSFREIQKMAEKQIRLLNRSDSNLDDILASMPKKIVELSLSKQNDVKTLK